MINDLVTDRRIDKTAKSLEKLGFEVIMVGRRKRDSQKLEARTYHTRRMFLIFEKGPFFYAEYNIRLFLFLLFHRANLLVSNDLDTLLPNFLVSGLKRIPVVYDTHEYFTGVPELVDRPKVQRFWKRIEKWIVPRLKEIITVNRSIAKLYEEEYGIRLHVVRNIPPSPDMGSITGKSELGLPHDKKIILLQGAGINIERGAEEAVQAMQYIDDAILLIIGGGDVIGYLKKISGTPGLKDKIIFIPKQPFDRLIHYTRCADIGITLDKDTNINYRFSLPNKLFDYIHAGIPIVASPLIEIKNIIETYDIGVLIRNHDPKHIAEVFNNALWDEAARERWIENLQRAARELNWEKEEKILLEIFKKYA